MIKCGECGYENMDGLDYCDGCGAKLAAAAGSAAAAPAAAAPEATPAAAPAESTDGSGRGRSARRPKRPSRTRRPVRSSPKPRPRAHPRRRPPRAHRSRRSSSIVRGGPRKGQEFPLEDGNNLIGRWDPETGSFPEVDLDADDPEAKISRKHALIRIDGGKITIEDIGSLNGTYVNRQPRLSPGSPAEIKSGDEVIIGKTFLKLVVEPIS